MSIYGVTSQHTDILIAVCTYLLSELLQCMTSQLHNYVCTFTGITLSSQLKFLKLYTSYTVDPCLPEFLYNFSFPKHLDSYTVHSYITKIVQVTESDL